MATSASCKTVICDAISKNIKKMEIDNKHSNQRSSAHLQNPNAQPTADFAKELISQRF